MYKVLLLPRAVPLWRSRNQKIPSDKDGGREKGIIMMQRQEHQSMLEVPITADK